MSSYVQNVKDNSDIELREVCCKFENTEDITDFLYTFIKQAPYYLIFAFGCTWKGADGYKFTKNVVDFVFPSYNSCLYLKDVSKRGKVLECIESTHDNPTGYTLDVIALTEKEYQSLKNATFDKVKNFVKIVVEKSKI